MSELQDPAGLPTGKGDCPPCVGPFLEARICRELSLDREYMFMVVTRASYVSRWGWSGRGHRMYVVQGAGISLQDRPKVNLFGMQ